MAKFDFGGLLEQAASGVLNLLHDQDGDKEISNSALPANALALSPWASLGNTSSMAIMEEHKIAQQQRRKSSVTDTAVRINRRGSISKTSTSSPQSMRRQSISPVRRQSTSPMQRQSRRPSVSCSSQQRGSILGNSQGNCEHAQTTCPAFDGLPAGLRRVSSKRKLLKPPKRPVAKV
eukprot:CAMPEP_0181291192 /NCGR_PEP_ID=MMETSP1101-20121128/1834_1 /TAXON_ID=46948 /ORGANISM="Rhodomonas abbreviata, Strain Caron Lab Isolate" /LENGTH=176 /DNA_ID=CAMNT_0023395563 /DNA_START=53 /DNA_END=583 /DNA_ORIENTATION=-